MEDYNYEETPCPNNMLKINTGSHKDYQYFRKKNIS